MITVHSLKLVNRSEDLSRAGTMSGGRLRVSWGRAPGSRVLGREP